MVSKASEDLPEPDRPVNTTSLSRGISTSMFLRLCSRAPRIVIARVAGPACWRFALRTSSISAFPGALIAPRFGGHSDPMISPEHRKNAIEFPVPAANHQRFVAKAVAGARREPVMAGLAPAIHVLFLVKTWIL